MSKELKGIDDLSKWLGLRWVSADTVRLEIRPELMNPAGLLSGAVAYAMIDYCMGSTLWAQRVKGERIATIGISINYVQTAREGEATCTSVLDRRNDRIAVLRSEVVHEDGRILATAVGSFSIFPSERVEVRAAGGVIKAPGDVPLALAVHRPRYDDWSLPKGKLDSGEDFEQAALREVLEETGLNVVLERPLSPARYRDRKGRPKIVRYWLMALAGKSAQGDPGQVIKRFKANDEVDDLRWVSPAEAAKVLTYERDAELVAEAFGPPTDA